MLVTLLKSLLGLLRPHLAQIPWNTERRQVTPPGTLLAGRHPMRRTMLNLLVLLLAATGALVLLWTAQRRLM